MRVDKTDTSVRRGVLEALHGRTEVVCAASSMRSGRCSIVLGGTAHLQSWIEILSHFRVLGFGFVRGMVQESSSNVPGSRHLGRRRDARGPVFCLVVDESGNPPPYRDCLLLHVGAEGAKPVSQWAPHRCPKSLLRDLSATGLEVVGAVHFCQLHDVPTGDRAVVSPTRRRASKTPRRTEVEVRVDKTDTSVRRGVLEALHGRTEVVCAASTQTESNAERRTSLSVTAGSDD